LRQFLLDEINRRFPQAKISAPPQERQAD